MKTGEEVFPSGRDLIRAFLFKLTSSALPKYKLIQKLLYKVILILEYNVQRIEDELSLKKQSQLIQQLIEGKDVDEKFEMLLNRWAIRFYGKYIEDGTWHFKNKGHIEMELLKPTYINSSIEYFKVYLKENSAQDLRLTIEIVHDLFRYYLSCNQFEKAIELKKSIDKVEDVDEEGKKLIEYITETSRIFECFVDSSVSYDCLSTKIEEAMEKENYEELILLLTEDLHANELAYHYRDSLLKRNIPKTIKCKIRLSNITWRIFHTPQLIQELYIVDVDVSDDHLLLWGVKTIGDVWRKLGSQDSHRLRIDAFLSILCNHVTNTQVYEVIRSNGKYVLSHYCNYC